MKNEIVINEGIEAGIERNNLTIKSEKGSLERTFSHPHIKMKKEDNKIVLVSDLERKKVKAIMGTWQALIRNMMIGVRNEWRAELKTMHSHFPMKLKVENNELIIENFLGERNPRKVPIPENLNVGIKGNEIVITGTSKEDVGQLAARIEQTTRVRGYDKRVFQDGCYITRKPYSLEGTGHE
jgi:large subunit ribosomal protein L6